MTDLTTEATRAQTHSPWEAAARRYADALLPAPDAKEAADLALVVAQFDGGGDDESVVLGAVRATVASRVMDKLRDASAAGRGLGRECAGIPELLLARAQGKVAVGADEQLAKHLASCPRCRALDQKIHAAEFAFYAQPATGRFRQAPPAVAAPTEPEPLVEQEPEPPAHVDPEFDASVPIATVAAAQWSLEEESQGRLGGPRINRRLLRATAAGLLVLGGIAVAAVALSGGTDDAPPAPPVPAVSSPQPAKPPAFTTRPAVERRASKPARRQARRRARPEPRRTPARATAPVSTPEPAPVAAPPAATVTPKPRKPTPERRPAKPSPKPATPDGPEPSPPADAPGRQPPG
jgi:hypothetical protein